MGSAWDSPLGTCPVLEHHLSTAGRFHGDHSGAGLHGYRATLALGWGLMVVPGVPVHPRTAGLAGWRQQHVGAMRSQAAAGGQFVPAARLRAQSSPPGTL